MKILQIRTYFLIFPVILLSMVRLAAGQSANDVFTWPGNAKCAVCLTYDDCLNSHLDIMIPQRDTYNIKGTFYIHGLARTIPDRIDEWRKVAANGHELGNHTLFHPCEWKHKPGDEKREYDLRDYSLETVLDEHKVSNSLLQAIDGKTKRLLAYPCCNYRAGGVSFVDEIKPMFTSARAGGEIPASVSEIDVYIGPRKGFTDNQGKEMIEFEKEAEKKGTLATFLFHGVGDEYGKIDKDAHAALLLNLHENKDKYWIAPFTEVMEYVKKNT